MASDKEKLQRQRLRWTQNAGKLVAIGTALVKNPSLLPTVIKNQFPSITNDARLQAFFSQHGAALKDVHKISHNNTDVELLERNLAPLQPQPQPTENVIDDQNQRALDSTAVHAMLQMVASILVTPITQELPEEDKTLDLSIRS